MPVTENHHQKPQAHFQLVDALHLEVMDFICTSWGFGTGKVDTATGRATQAWGKYFQKEIRRKRRRRRRIRPTHFYKGETGSEEVLDDAVDREADRASDAVRQGHQGLPAPPRVTPPGPEEV